MTILQVSALRRKLESKSQALLILTEELNKCRIERDQYKFWVEQENNSTQKFADSEVIFYSCIIYLLYIYLIYVRFRPFIFLHLWSNKRDIHNIL